jgi:hypothetical protein
LAVDAVAIEPVSTANFPANREKNREFRKIASYGAPEIQNYGAVAGFLTRIPYRTEQGIISKEQGILAQEQGNKIGNFPTIGDSTML